MCEVPNIMSTVLYSAVKVNPNKNTEGLNRGKIHCHFDGNVNVVVYQFSMFMFILIGYFQFKSSKTGANQFHQTVLTVH